LDPNNGNALNSLGFVLAETGKNPQRAVDYCRRAIRIRPKSAAYLDSLGWACYKLGRIEEARDALRSALNAAPGEKEIAVHLRQVMQHQSGERPS